MSVGSLIGVALSSYLPGSEPAIKSMVGMMIGNTVERFGTRITEYTGTTFLQFWNSKDNVIIINKTDKNPIYQKIESYIVHKHLENITKCLLEPMNGEIVFKLKEAQFNKPLIEDFEGHQIYLKIDITSIKVKDDIIQDIQNKILITSRTAKISIIKKFIESVCQFKKDSSFLTVYRAIVEPGAEDKNGRLRAGSAYWSEIITINNKRVANTILSEDNEIELYQDIKWFMNNKVWYDQRGIPYKRGYLLYGIPGTGKTSVIKAVANEYKIDIFSIQMDVIENDSQFILLMTQISEHVGNKPYILALEDFDRCKLFESDRWGNSTNDKRISFGTILNELDGVSETYGRILIITSNDKNKFNNVSGIDALFRPGRVDKQIELIHCTNKQIQSIVNQFTGFELEIDKIGNEKVTPAQLISLLQKNVSKEEDLNDFITHIQSMANEKSFSAMVEQENPDNGFGSKRKSRKKVIKKNTPVTRRQKQVKNISNQITRIKKDYENLKKMK